MAWTKTDTSKTIIEELLKETLGHICVMLDVLETFFSVSSAPTRSFNK